MPGAELILTGTGLTPSALEAAARSSQSVTLSDDGMEKITAARGLIDAAVASATPVYGVTTGLGSRATEALSAEALSDFSTETILGRAHATGPALPAALTRAAIIVRLNSFLIGASGASPAVVRHLADVVNAGLTPRVGSYGSIGAADLLLGASAACACWGFGGRIARADGTETEARSALQDAGLTPPELGPRDGLALANHACFSAAAAALAGVRAERALASAMAVTALSFLGFQGNMGTMSETALALKGHPGDRTAARRLAALLADSIIADPTNARRLQDPLSYRNAVQCLGSLTMALEETLATVATEINGSSDNPAVLTQEGRVVSTGNYYTPHLTRVCNGLSQSLSAAAALTVGRIAKLNTARLSGLPQYLADPQHGTNGFAPVLKLAESILADIHKAAAPVATWPSINADGVEDAMTHSFQAARDLDRTVELFEKLVAIEAIVAAQACDLRPIAPPRGLADLYHTIRRIAPYVRESRPLGEDIETLSQALFQPSAEKAGA